MSADSCGPPLATRRDKRVAWRISVSAQADSTRKGELKSNQAKVPCLPGTGPLSAPQHRQSPPFLPRPKHLLAHSAAAQARQPSALCPAPCQASAQQACCCRRPRHFIFVQIQDSRLTGVVPPPTYSWSHAWRSTWTDFSLLSVDRSFQSIFQVVLFAGKALILANNCVAGYRGCLVLRCFIANADALRQDD